MSREASLRGRVRGQAVRPAGDGSTCERLVIRAGHQPPMGYCGRRAGRELDGVPYCPHHLDLGLKSRGLTRRA